MDLFFILLVIISGFLAISYLIIRISKKSDLTRLIETLELNSREDRKVLLESLKINSQSITTSVNSTNTLLLDVKKEVTEVAHVGKAIKEFQEYLKHPKFRGNIGEQILNEMLSQMLPKTSYKLQYSFSSGDKVDALLFTSSGNVPIDSKFPLDNYQKFKNEGGELSKKLFERDVKSHIDSISKKYINSDEGTTDYAIMYIPSESVFYEILNSVDLYDYALKKGVILASPLVIFPFLKSIVLGLEGQKIEYKAKTIMKNINGIYKEFENFNTSFKLMSRHMVNASGALYETESRARALGAKISSIKDLG